MWPNQTQPDNIVALVVGADSLACALIIKENHKNVSVHAYETHALECVSAPLIRAHLKNFVGRHKRDNSFCTIALQAPLIHEDLVKLSTASPSPADFSHTPVASLIWDYTYLHGLDDGTHMFYVRGIKKSVLLEYELIARHANLILTTLTSAYAAQLTAYTRVHGKSFRQTQRAVDLIKHNYQIAHSLPATRMEQLLSINNTLDADRIDINTKATLIGMYYH